ncbi:MAG: cupin domain-containing protein [Acetobacter sp.]
MGERIRECRKRQNMPLKLVAQCANISVGYLSQIERGLSFPSVKDLAQISQCLGVPLNSLIDGTVPEQHESFVLRLAQRKVSIFENGVTKLGLSPSREGGLGLFMVVLEPGGRSGETLYSHEGVEAGLVLNGQLTLVVEDQTTILSEGDSFQFASTRSHRFFNSFPGVTRVAWVNLKDSASSQV